MEITKAVQRLGWRFKKASERNDHSFKINQNDLEALKSINDYVVKSQKNQFHDYDLFAKLYINYLIELIEHYQTTIFDSVPRRRINNILKQPLPDLIKRLMESLNDNEKYSLFQEIGVDIKHPTLQSTQEASANLLRLKNALEIPDGKNRFFGEIHSFEFVRDCIENEVNRVINNYHYSNSR